MKLSNCERLGWQVSRVRHNTFFHFQIRLGYLLQCISKECLMKCINIFPKQSLGRISHTTPFAWKEKVEAAYQSGCVRFDGAIKGYGGCPMAKDDLVGNMPTERLIDYFGYDRLKLKKAHFEGAFQLAENIFNHYL